MPTKRPRHINKAGSSSSAHKQERFTRSSARAHSARSNNHSGGLYSRKSRQSAEVLDRSARARAAHAAVTGVTVRAAQEEPAHVTLPGGQEFAFSRRHFIIGAAGVAVLAAAGGAAYVASSKKAEAADVTTLKVPEDAVTSSADFTLIENSDSVMQLSASIELPYGSMVWANDDAIAACLIPTDTASPLTQIGLVSLGSGTYVTVLENAVGAAEGFQIYDVRACAGGLIWSEADILENTWRIYSASSDGATIGAPVLVEEGGGDWEMPTLAAVAGYGFWQKMPKPDSAARRESSVLMRAPFGAETAEEIYSSPGRFATAPYADRTTLVITPRADTGTSHYQLTYLDAKSGAALDKLVLPSSMKPYEAGYGKNGFSFAFNAIYDYGEGISNLGTYTPMTAMAVAADSAGGDVSASERTTAYSDVPWFRFALDPSAASAPAWCGNWFIVKTQYQVGGVNLDTQERFSLSAPNGTEDFGDYLASTGSGQHFVTYSNMDYKALDGTTQKHCLVRVWSPVTA